VRPPVASGSPRVEGRRPRSADDGRPAGVPAPRTLSGPRARPVPPTDLASRSRLIANQRHRTRLAGRSLRLLARVTVLGVTLAGLGVAAFVAWDWVRRTPLLATRTVEVTGAHRLDEATVRAAAGIEPGTNLFAVDVAAAEDRVAGLPGVRRAHVVRHLPGRVTVLVEEREPYALVNAGGLHWVDAEGYLVTTDARPGATGLPILTGVGAPAPGASAPSESLRSGLALLHVFQRTSGRLTTRVSEVDLSRPHGPVLYLVDGIEVRLGPDGWSDRLARLDGVLGELDARGERVASVDLRFRDQVVLTPRSSSPSAGPVKGPAAGRRRPGGDFATIATPAAAGLERR
jgi:cell division septal protein FtsQ